MTQSITLAAVVFFGVLGLRALEKLSGQVDELRELLERRVDEVVDNGRDDG